MATAQDVQPIVFKPLSEDILRLPGGGHEIIAAKHEQAWQETISLSRGEQRHLNFDFRVPAGHHGAMLRVLRVAAGARLTLSISLRVGAEADWSSIIAVEGEGEVVIQRVVSSIGPSAKVFLATVALLNEQAKLQVDDDIHCDALRFSVTLRTHTVLNNEARADVRGRVVVPVGAVGSTVDESLCHLLLGDKAKARAIPELDIAEPDVQCKHRSFIGRPRDDARFFLQSRGLSEMATNQLLAQGFLGSALAGVPQEIVDRTFKALRLAV